MLAGCSAGPETIELRGQTMGTSYSIRVVEPPSRSGISPEVLRQQVTARLDELEYLFSTYRPDSEVSRFNASTGEDWTGVSQDFLEVLELAAAASELTGSAFDPTVGPLVELWGFGAGGEGGQVPERTELERHLQATGFSHLGWRHSPPSVRRTRPGIQLDFSGIAKGYAVDEIWDLLAAAGFTAFLVEIGGEVRTRGRRADGRDWTVGVESPDASGIAGVVPMRDSAIATSGDYRNYFEHEGRRYSHVLDPRSGWPVSHDLAAVSVVNSTAAMADALATALLVLGPAKGYELAEREGIAALLVVRSAEGLQVTRTPAYETVIGDPI